MMIVTSKETRSSNRYKRNKTNKESVRQTYRQTNNLDSKQSRAYSDNGEATNTQNDKSIEEYVKIQKSFLKPRESPKT